ncbi:MAG: tetratricopeptide repeat protein [Spirochaetota bacterium]
MKTIHQRPKNSLHCIPALLLMLLTASFVVGPGAAPASATARERFAVGAAAEERGEYIVAIQRYREALDLNGNYADAWYGLARSFVALSEYDQALEAVREAARRARRNPDIIALEGDILLLLGRIEEAADAYNRILATEPNNVSARIGLAELAVAEGRTQTALETYRTVLSISPENRPAILALAVLYDERGDMEAAERYLALALEFHPRDPFVHELVSRYYLRAGRYDLARSHAETAVALSPDFARGWELLARTELSAGDYDAAVAASDRLIQVDPDSARAFYLLGLSYEGRDSFEEAVDAFDRSLRISPDDEVTRYALESTVDRGFDLEDPVREDIAQFRFDRAESLIEQNQLMQAHAEYRRGLLINPSDRDGRFAFAGLQRRMGFDGKMLAELRVLERLGFADRQIEEEIELYEYLRQTSLENTWEVDQFALERDRLSFSMFHTHDHGADSRPSSGRFVAEFLRHRLIGSELIDIEELPLRVSSPEEAFDAARSADTDYFLVVTFEETERSIELSVTVSHSATGTRVAEFNVSRTGSGAVQRAAAAIADRLEAAIPGRGRLLSRDGRDVLVSIGRADGVSEEDELVVVRDGMVATEARELGYRYDPSDRLGTVTVTEVDDLIAEGRLTREGFFDLFALGDTVLLDIDDRVRSIDDRPAFGPLYWRIREIR